MNSNTRFKEKEKVGKGTYGEVYKALDMKYNQIVALKKVFIQNEDEGIPSTVLREISLIKGITHPNIVQLKDVIIETSKIYLIFEFVDRDLKIFIDSMPADMGLDSRLIKLLLATNELHKRRIIHRDIKPQNILIAEDLVLKLADFGLARAFTIPVRPYTNQVVTLWYRAPEVLLEAQEYSTPIDVWSIGCILAELSNKAPLFTGDSEIDQIFRIFRVLGTPTEKEWPGITNCKKFQPIYPHYERKRLTSMVPRLDETGIDLLEVY